MPYIPCHRLFPSRWRGNIHYISCHNPFSSRWRGNIHYISCHSPFFTRWRGNIHYISCHSLFPRVGGEISTTFRAQPFFHTMEGKYPLHFSHPCLPTKKALFPFKEERPFVYTILFSQQFVDYLCAFRTGHHCFWRELVARSALNQPQFCCGVHIRRRP
ncbi:hypothetical protein D3C75_1047320 [compost metagenome]